MLSGLVKVTILLPRSLSSGTVSNSGATVRSSCRGDTETCRSSPDCYNMHQAASGVTSSAGVMKPCMGDMHTAALYLRAYWVVSRSVWFCVLSTTTATRKCKNPNGRNKNHTKPSTPPARSPHGHNFVNTAPNRVIFAYPKISRPVGEHLDPKKRTSSLGCDAPCVLSLRGHDPPQPCAECILTVTQCHTAPQMKVVHLKSVQLNVNVAIRTA